MKTGLQIRDNGSALALTLWLLLPVVLQAQFTTPLHIYAPKRIADEQGIPLQGSFSAPGDCVQIYWASNGVIHAPAVDGSPHANNPPMVGGEGAIGKLARPSDPAPGTFAYALNQPRPANGSKFFVRVFNAKTPEEATFYADSSLLTASGNDILKVSFTATTHALDTRDVDQDGLNNSWERSLGSDENKPDSDDDGMTDGDEFAAGTDVTDADSVMAILQLSSTADGVRIRWASVPGKNYSVQRQTGLLNGCFETVADPVTAVDSETEMLLEESPAASRALYRIQLEVE